MRERDSTTGKNLLSRVAARPWPGAQTACQQFKLQTTVGSKKMRGRMSRSRGWLGNRVPVREGFLQNANQAKSGMAGVHLLPVPPHLGPRQMSSSPPSRRCPSGLSPRGSAQPQTTLPSHRTTRLWKIQSQVKRATYPILFLISDMISLEMAFSVSTTPSP